jgi:OPA family glycerol-3-phosphate transporter-like MFS transporter
MEYKKALSKQIFIRKIVFLITFLGYASLHSSRTTWSFVSHDFADSIGKKSEYVGMMNSIFLFFYSFSNIILGQFGDRMNLTLFVSLGMFVSCISFGSIGLLSMFEIKNEYIYPFLMALNGMAQATGFPGSMAILSNWYG